MRDDRYAETLEAFKADERPEVVLLIGDDVELIRIIVAWTNTAVRPSPKLTRLPEGSAHQSWEWLWRNTRYSRQELSAKSGLSGHVLNRKLETLIGNRVIYPDGTMNSFVQRYLRDRVLKLFEAKPRPARRRRVEGTA
jgi:hypothetical protein